MQFTLTVRSRVQICPEVSRKKKRLPRKHRRKSLFVACLVGDTGPEQVPHSSGKQGVRIQSGADSGALPALSAIDDPDLRAIIEAWPGLSAKARRAILRTAGIGSEDSRVHKQ